MRKAVLLAIFVGVSIGLLTIGNASAQSSPSIYAVKFVCGKQAPINSLTPPAEPPVKPGNYATKVNVELLSLPNPNGGGGVSWNVSLAGGGGPSLTTLANPLNQLETVDVTCAAIVKQLGWGQAACVHRGLR